MSVFEVTFYGTRGSSPAPGAEYSLYGGNTSCVLLRLDDRIFVLDAGTGIIPLGHDIKKQGIRRFDIFLTHAHYDHVQGLPFFVLLMEKGVDVTLWYAGSEDGRSSEEIIDALFSQPFLPFSLDDLKCNLTFRTLPHDGTFSLTPDVTLKTAPLNHPGGCTGLRFQAKNLSFIYAPDFEHDDGPADKALVEFLADADFAVLDATYTPDEYPACSGFGHASWVKCMELAAAAGLKRWALFHHAHHRTDASLCDIEKQTQAMDRRALVAREGLVFNVCSGAVTQAKVTL